MRITKSKITTPVQEGSRLLQAVGWAVILPQMLATWRYIREVRRWTSCFRLSRTSATDRVSVRCRYGVLFRHDAIYSRNGKCIRAFAVITGGIGLPLIVQMHGGNPAIMAKTRYVCWILRNVAYSNGANFNIVPAMLLELKDKMRLLKRKYQLLFQFLS